MSEFAREPNPAEAQIGQPIDSEQQAALDQKNEGQQLMLDGMPGAYNPDRALVKAANRVGNIAESVANFAVRATEVADTFSAKFENRRTATEVANDTVESGRNFLGRIGKSITNKYVSIKESAQEKWNSVETHTADSIEKARTNAKDRSDQAKLNVAARKEQASMRFDQLKDTGKEKLEAGKERSKKFGRAALKGAVTTGYVSLGAGIMVGEIAGKLANEAKTRGVEKANELKTLGTEKTVKAQKAHFARRAQAFDARAMRNLSKASRFSDKSQ